jgi:AcrR family transcriptional regulator
MLSGMPPAPLPVRRKPVQKRSRARVARILDAAEEVVATAGVQALTTREIARRAGVPVATLYQYFADREAIMGALIEGHIASMDARLTRALASLDVYSVRAVVEAVIAAYRADYRQRPSYVVLWFQGRAGAEIAALVAERGRALADSFHEFGITAGLLRAQTPSMVLRLCFEVADRFLESAYRQDLRGDDQMATEGTEMIVAHLERYATPAGIAGLPTARVSARWHAPKRYLGLAA